jgi:hypothetical protein
MDALMKLIEALIFAQKKAGRLGLALGIAGLAFGVLLAAAAEERTIWTFILLPALGTFIGTGIAWLLVTLARVARRLSGTFRKENQS